MYDVAPKRWYQSLLPVSRLAVLEKQKRSPHLPTNDVTPLDMNF